MALFDKFDSGTLLPSAREAALQVLAAARSNRQQFVQAGWDPTSWDQSLAKAQAVLDRIDSMGSGPTARTPNSTPSRVVRIEINNKAADIGVSDERSAQMLEKMLKELERSMGRSA